MKTGFGTMCNLVTRSFARVWITSLSRYASAAEFRYREVPAFVSLPNGDDQPVSLFHPHQQHRAPP